MGSLTGIFVASAQVPVCRRALRTVPDLPVRYEFSSCSVPDRRASAELRAPRETIHFSSTEPCGRKALIYISWPPDSFERYAIQCASGEKTPCLRQMGGGQQRMCPAVLQAAGPRANLPSDWLN